jgi:tetratricopeptide (TPR) repeat protein
MSNAGSLSLRRSVVLFACVCGLAKAQEAGAASPVQTALREGDSAFGRGAYEGARRVFEKALEAATDDPLRYEILKRLTSASAASGQFEEAGHYLQRAMELRESGAGPNDAKLEGDLLLSVNLDLRTKDFDRALATAERVEGMHTSTYGAGSIPVADDLLRIGQIYLAEKKPHEALRALNTAAGVRTKLVGPLDPGLLPVLDRINEAFVAISGGGGSGSEGVLRQALAIRETTYGTDSSELISTIEGLANAYTAGGMYVAAEPLYERLLALWEGMVGKDHPMVAVTLDKMVVFYAKIGEPKKAREALARSVGIRARFLAVGLSHQATDEISENHQEQAKALYQRALAALGPGNPDNDELVGELRKTLDDLSRAPGNKAAK